MLGIRTRSSIRFGSVVGISVYSQTPPAAYRVGAELRRRAEAMEQVDRHNPDLMLLDLNLPNVDGLTVLRKLRAETNTEHLPIVVLTARGDEDNEVKVLRAGATDFITKPFRPKPLLARLAATLARLASRTGEK